MALTRETTGGSAHANDVASRELSIVVPLYNEAAGLAMLHERLTDLARTLRARYGLASEVVYVDDGSADATLAIARTLKAETFDVQVVSLSRNFGKEAALMAGLDHARRGAQLAANDETELTVGEHPGLTHVYTNRSLWDFLCDCVPADDSMRESTPASDSFRSPQYMNLYLTAPARALDQSNIGMLHNYLVARYNKRTWQNANQMLRPYMATLAAKWGMSETQFEQTFADETKYGKLDILATVDGQVVNKPK